MKTQIMLSLICAAVVALAGCRSPNYDSMHERDPYGRSRQKVEVEVRCLAFNKSDISSLTQTKGFNMIDSDSLLEIFREGKGTLLFAPHLAGTEGMEIQIKGTSEIIYPVGAVDTGRPTVIPPQASNTNASAVSPVGNAEDTGFETREAGAIFTLTPSVTLDLKEIEFYITGTLTFEPSWHKHIIKTKDKEIEVKQPVFSTQSFSTSIRVANGIPTLIGGGTLNTANDTIVYTIITARILPPMHN